MPIRRTLAAALLCALPFAHAHAAEEAAQGETVGWVLPWKADTSLEYASEDYTVSELGERKVARATSTATARIAEAMKDGYVQVWSWRDAKYVVEEGDKSDEAAMRQLAAAMGDMTLDVELDAAGNYARVRNLAQITPRLREAMRPIMQATLEANLGRIADTARREEARKAAAPQVEGFVDRMLAPAVLETLLARNIQWYNAFVGIDIEPDQNYEARTELPNPMGGAIPVTITFSLSVSGEDPDDMFVAFEQKIDRENGGAAATAIIEGLMGQKLPVGQEKLEISVVDEGLFVVHRPTGVVEMFESTRTVAAGEQRKIERHRLRLLNGEHAHVWLDEEEASGAGGSAP